MKKLVLGSVLLTLGLSFANAQGVTTLTSSEKKVMEVKKIITISANQESSLKQAYDKNQNSSDSILLNVSDPTTAAKLNYQANKQLNKTVMTTLTDSQRVTYITVTSTPEVTEKAKAKVATLSSKGTYTQAQLDSAQNKTISNLMQQKIIYASNKYDYQTQANNLSKLKSTAGTDSADKRINEIKKIITISSTQETAIRQAYKDYLNRNDSIASNVKDASTLTSLKRKSNKTYHKTFMRTLTESQRNKYITVTSTPEVTEKAAAKVASLKETGNYTQGQLDSAQTQIFNYLMLEKVVYARDKYDYSKQKENIAQLKKLKPTYLKQIDTQQKLKIEGSSKARYQL